MCQNRKNASVLFDNMVLYPNPYVVVTSKGYTKHYYAGTERIATVIGTGGFDDMVYAIDKLSSPQDQDIIKTFYSYYQNYDPFFYQKIVSQPEKTEDIFGKPSSDLDYLCTPTELVMVDILNPQDILLKSISINEQNNGPEKEVYFYHGDHLGSANWITDYTGAPIQYIHYAPYGELIDNQVPYGYDERYKFTGKERDEETGYDYFGARFYWQAGTWLSVDPWADKYPQISPYAYCGWNPIKFVDPDGRYFDDTNEETAQKIEAELFTKKIYAALGNNNQMRELYSTWKDIQDMRNDGKNEYRFELDKNKPGTTSKEEDGHQIITMYSNLETLDETVAHEVRHGGQTARGEISYDNNNQKQNYDVEKEVDAYRAQWGWRGSPLQIPIDDGKHPIPVPANANYFDITNKLIKSITNGWLDKNDKLYNFK